MNFFRRVYAPKCINVVPLQATDSLGSDTCGQCCYIIGQHLGLCVPGWPSLRPPPPPQKNGVINGLLGDTNILCCSAFPSFAPHPLVHIGALPFDVTNHAKGGGVHYIIPVITVYCIAILCRGARVQGQDRRTGQASAGDAKPKFSKNLWFCIVRRRGGGVTDRQINLPSCPLLQLMTVFV